MAGAKDYTDSRLIEIDGREYIIENHNRIGRGTFGYVFSGIAKDFPVAIKRLQGTLDKEAFLLQNNKAHPNIIKMLDIKEEPGSLMYLVMERCECNIEEYFQEEQSEDHRYSVMEQTTSGVEFLHRNNICHRDLKPSNILIAKRGEDPTVKIIDFGLMANTANRSTMETGCGTKEFMAPELFNKNGRRYKIAVDIFSLGLIFLFVLEPDIRIFHCHKFGETLHGDKDADIFCHFKIEWQSFELESTIRQMLSREPKERPTALDVFIYLLQVRRVTSHKKDEAKRRQPEEELYMEINTTETSETDLIYHDATTPPQLPPTRPAPQPNITSHKKDEAKRRQPEEELYMEPITTETSETDFIYHDATTPPQLPPTRSAPQPNNDGPATQLQSMFVSGQSAAIHDSPMHGSISTTNIFILDERSCSFHNERSTCKWESVDCAPPSKVAKLKECTFTYIPRSDGFYIAGGKIKKENNGFEFSKRVFSFSTISKVWEKLPSFDKGRSNASGGFLDKQIVVFGGENEEGHARHVESYDTARNRSIGRKNKWKRDGDIADELREGATISTTDIFENCIWVMERLPRLTELTEETRSAKFFKVNWSDSGLQWNKQEPFSHRMNATNGGNLIANKGKLYMVGGESRTFAMFHNAQWTTLKPCIKKRLYAAVVIKNDILYKIGGWVMKEASAGPCAESAGSDDIEQYKLRDDLDEQWEQSTLQRLPKIMTSVYAIPTA